jgi:hypothetical protein
MTTDYTEKNSNEGAMMPVRLCMAAFLILLAGCSSHPARNRSTTTAAGQVPVPAEEFNLAADANAQKMVDLTLGDNRVVIFSYDNQPLIMLKENCVKGDRVLALIASRSAGGVVYRVDRDGGGEVDKDAIIDYSGWRNGIFHVIECTPDCRTEDDETVPFLKRTITITKDGSVSELEQVVLTGQHATAEQIKQLREQIIAQVRQMKGTQAPDVCAVWNLLLQLRNIGITTPDPVLAAFAEINKQIGEAPLGDELDWGGLTQEVEWAKELRTKGIRSVRD